MAEPRQLESINLLGWARVAGRLIRLQTWEAIRGSSQHGPEHALLNLGRGSRPLHVAKPPVQFAVLQVQELELLGQLDRLGPWAAPGIGFLRRRR